MKKFYLIGKKDTGTKKTYGINWYLTTNGGWTACDSYDDKTPAAVFSITEEEAKEAAELIDGFYSEVNKRDLNLIGFTMIVQSISDNPVLNPLTLEQLCERIEYLNISKFEELCGLRTDQIQNWKRGRCKTNPQDLEKARQKLEWLSRKEPIGTPNKWRH